MIKACPACESRRLEGFFELEGVPANSCLLFEQQSEAKSYPKGRLDLAICCDCGFITNRTFEPELTEYSGRYEETQSYSPTFVAFGRTLAQTWVNRYALHGKHILEIGCGKGEFLTWMLEAGAGSGTGIDPGVKPERPTSLTDGRVEWIVDFYDQRYLQLQADAIVCRHVLEHIAPVRDFVNLVRRHIDGGDTPVLFEVPETERVLAEGAFWDLYYEHCSYFTATSLSALFRRCGFEVVDTSVVYDDQYLLLEARPAAVAPEAKTQAGEHNTDHLVDRALRFTKLYQDTVAQWSGRLVEVGKREGKTVIWGGGSKAVALLCVPSISEQVSAVVDMNPHKQGCYLAGSGHKVIAPGDLRALDPELIVVANPVYLQEVRTIVATLDLASEVVAL